MADYFTYYTLEKEEIENIRKTCKILSNLEDNNSLNARFNFTLIKELLGWILTNENNKLKI